MGERPQLYGPFPPVEIPDDAADELGLEGPLRAEDWREIFSTVPMYPLNLPDNLVREIADLAINVRTLAETVEKGLANKDTLTTWMGPSLVSGSLKRVRELILNLEQRLKVQEKGRIW